jgi:hypothetical protein
MAYQQLEELTSRKREKVALLLTAEHMAGILAVAVPVYAGTSGTSFWLRAVLLLLAAVLGLLVTSDLNGMAAYERALWWLRGRVRRLLIGRVVDPLEFAAARSVHHGRALPVGQGVRRKRATHMEARADNVSVLGTRAGTVRSLSLDPSQRVRAMATPLGADDAHL